MSDLEGMINGILSNPEEMKKIMEMAGKIMGPESGSGAAPPNSDDKATPSLDSILSGLKGDGFASAAGNLMGSGGLESILSSGAIQKLMGSPTLQKLIGSPLVQNLVGGSASSAKNDKKELFEALKPYLSEKRRFKLEKAIVFAKVMRVAGVAGATVLKKGG